MHRGRARRSGRLWSKWAGMVGEVHSVGPDREGLMGSPQRNPGRGISRLYFHVGKIIERMEVGLEWEVTRVYSNSPREMSQER